MPRETKVSCGHRIDGQPRMGTRFASAPVSDGAVPFEYGPRAVRQNFLEEGRSNTTVAGKFLLDAPALNIQPSSD